MAVSMWCLACVNGHNMHTSAWENVRSLAMASGVSLHWFAFRHGEWDTNASTIVVGYVSTTIMGMVFLFHSPVVYNNGILISAMDFPLLITYHLLGLYASMLIYRGFLHKLRRFPGPFVARLTTFYLTALTSKRLLIHEDIHQLHRKYGDYVRVGPTELSVIDPAAVAALYGNRSNTSKGPWYILMEPLDGLVFTRDKEEHAHRRKILDQALSSKALASYETVVSKCTEQFLQAIEPQLGAPVNITEWIKRYTFEIMGHLVFGRPFNTISKDGGDTFMLDSIHADMSMMGYLKHMPWLPSLLLQTPFFKNKNERFWRWLEQRFKERVEKGSENPDIFSWLLDAFEKGPKTNPDIHKLYGLGYSTLMAGSDTTFSATTFIFFNIARHSLLASELQRTLDELPELNEHHLRKVDLLNAVILETLRLHPPGAAGFQRLTPKEGSHIGDIYIPGGVLVQIPIYSLHRDARSFERPDEFIPERWTTRPDLVKDKTVFIPFQAGPYACAGRQLAMMEMRRITAEVLRRYDISLGPGQTEDEFIQGRVDTMVVMPAPLYLRFAPRQA